MPGTTICPMPATWSLTALSQVMPRLDPKYFGGGAALTVRTGTTDRNPSTEADSPSPQYRTIGTWPCASISAAFAAAMVSARRQNWSTCAGRPRHAERAAPDSGMAPAPLLRHQFLPGALLRYW